jgi:hypothetical protein
VICDNELLYWLVFGKERMDKDDNALRGKREAAAEEGEGGDSNAEALLQTEEGEDGGEADDLGGEAGVLADAKV